MTNAVMHPLIRKKSALDALKSIIRSKIFRIFELITYLLHLSFIFNISLIFICEFIFLLTVFHIPLCNA